MPQFGIVVLLFPLEGGPLTLAHTTGDQARLAVVAILAPVLPVQWLLTLSILAPTVSPWPLGHLTKY
jgi:hypothetical protein